MPEGHAGGKIVCAGAVRSGMLEGDPEWITNFPENFKLESKGHDAQTPAIKVELNAFSRPVLHFKIRPREDQEDYSRLCLPLQVEGANTDLSRTLVQ